MRGGAERVANSGSDSFRLIAEVHQRLLGGNPLLDNCALTAMSKDRGSIKDRSLAHSSGTSDSTGGIS